MTENIVWILAIFHIHVDVADNVKALYRRGKAHVGAWNPKEARSDLERVAELDRSMAKLVQKELANLDALERQKVSDDRNLFEGKIFSWIRGIFSIIDYHAGLSSVMLPRDGRTLCQLDVFYRLPVFLPSVVAVITFHRNLLPQLCRSVDRMEPTIW